jgi:hypothetical protein
MLSQFLHRCNGESRPIHVYFSSPWTSSPKSPRTNHYFEEYMSEGQKHEPIVQVGFPYVPSDDPAVPTEPAPNCPAFSLRANGHNPE